MSSNSQQEIHSEISQRLTDRRAQKSVAEGRERLRAGVALTVLFLGLIALVLSADGLIGVHWSLCLLLFLGTLIPLVVWRERASRVRKRLGYAVDWYERSLRRSEDRWDFGQDSGERYLDREHASAADLDLFGAGSLFERLNGCHTVLGRDALAVQIRRPDPEAALDTRQATVRELAERLDWREALETDLAELAERAGRTPEERARLEADTRALLDWGESETPAPQASQWIFVYAFCSLLAFVSLGLKFSLDWSWAVFLPFYFLNLGLIQSAKDLDPLLDRLILVRRHLEVWSRVLHTIETAPFDSEELVDMRARLARDTEPASRAIADLKHWSDRLAQRRNQAWFFVFGVMLLWDLHVRRGIYAWKRKHGPQLKTWLRTAAEFEALASLAEYARHVPDHVWPKPAQGVTWLRAESVAHPLLPRSARVGNSLNLDREGSVQLVTGSNMSGKSTWLRTIGISVTMANMGLPVCARSLHLCPLRVATSMRVEDSLRKGSSRFHAEVGRLKQVLDWSESGPRYLVLLDEILAGTNSRERHLGTRAILRRLVEGQVITLISTHDLALVALREQHPDQVDVVHFRDFVEDGVMRFDYRLRQGRLPSTNALEVMRLAGLDVSESDS